jgi:photosystem II stability/assembly factor-like uncharacterized protein
MREAVTPARASAALSVLTVVCCAVLAVLVASSAANVNVSTSGWAWSNPTPQGRTLQALAFSGGTGYAVGNGGTALSTSDAGHAWNGLTTGTLASLDRVQALAPATIIVGGGEGCVTRISSDGGKIFKRIFNVAESSCPEPVASFSFLSASNGFLLLENGSLERTTDGGESFARGTGVPGTPASSGGGHMSGTDLHFLTPTVGIAFVSDPSSGASKAYRTPDAGVSWAPVTLPDGARVTSVHFVDEKNAYAIGPETLLRSTDGGETWTAQPIAAGNTFKSIDCSTETTCILTVTAGNQLIETTDGGATDTVKTTSSSLIYGAAYATPLQIVAVGASGAIVLSSDGGTTFTPASADIGGKYSRLRRGPGAMLLAPGANGELAISSNNGASWQTLATQTSQTLIDIAFASPTLGYALDGRGGLQRTNNGGASWQTLNPGTSRPASAIAAVGTNAVLLIGPVGINRAVGGGAFAPLGGPIAKAELNDYVIVGATVFAFGRGGHSLLSSSDAGATWHPVPVPLSGKAKRGKGRHVKTKRGVVITSVAFTSPRSGMLLDNAGRLWSTRNRGRTWTQVLSTGSSDGTQLALADARNGFLSLGDYPVDDAYVHVLRTSDGGNTWHPQEIGAGSIPYGGLVASSALNGAALIEGESVTREQLNRLLFATTTGGDVAGTAEKLALKTPKAFFSKRKLKAAHHLIRVTGALAGAAGGETIVVSRRSLSGGLWEHRTVVAGANGGSFATTWKLRSSSVFVAQWSGDSGRPGQGSKPLKVIVR